jgi:hypothetical protein
MGEVMTTRKPAHVAPPSAPVATKQRNAVDGVARAENGAQRATGEAITIKGFTNNPKIFNALLWVLPSLLRNYRADPGKHGGNWYGRGVGRPSLVVYSDLTGLDGYVVWLRRTKTAIVVEVVAE